MKVFKVLSLITFISLISCKEDQRVLGLTERKSLSIQAILENHNQPDLLLAHEKQFKGETLAYVTPWNNRGYDIVKEFKGKFDFVSPVWYYIQRRSTLQFDFDGEHDVDEKWMKEVRDVERGKGKILPRFQLRGWTGDDLRMFISNPEEAKKLAKEVNQQVEKYKFDGVVIECGVPGFFKLFLKEISNLLHEKNRVLIVVLPSILTKEHKQYITPELYNEMIDYVDRFSIMTYDYSSHDPNGGPSSPIEWMMDNIDYITNENNRDRLLLGFNLYGMSYLHTRIPEPLVMKTVLEKLADQTIMDDELNYKDEELNWDSVYQEAWFVDYDEDGAKQGDIWIPTIRSIKNRIRLAEDYGVGIALWEVGQGLDYYYDLF